MYIALAPSAGGYEFLNRHIELRTKWAQAFDDDGRRYGQMTSNMAEIFNMVLKGVRALPVTAIVQYTFEKLNVYFLKYSEETDKQIAGENKDKYKYDYPPKVDEFMEFQSRKADSQVATCYDNVEWIYQVNEPGGTTQDGVQHGGRACKVWLKKCECSCVRPSLLHLACSHLLTAARIRNVDINHPLTVRESEFSIETTKQTWAPRFNPYLDQSQWPEYHGVQLWPNPKWKVITRGRRQTKRLRGDMDRWGRGAGNNLFAEPRQPAHCGSCDGEGHNKRKCSQRKKSKGNDATTSQPSPSQHGPSQQRSSQHGPSQHGPSQHGPSQHGPSQQRSSHHGPSQHGPSQHGPSQHAPSQQALSQQRSSHRAPSRHGPSQQRGSQLGLTRGRGGGRGRGVGRRTNMIGYLQGPFPYVTQLQFYFICYSLQLLFMITYCSLLTTVLQICIGMAASQPNKATTGWEEEKEEEGERPGWWQEAARKVIEEEAPKKAAEEARKKQEETKAWIKERERMNRVGDEMKRRFDLKIATAKKLREDEANKKWLKALAVANARVERDNREFNEKVLREARRAREKEEEEEEDVRKRKGKGPCSTQ